MDAKIIGMRHGVGIRLTHIDNKEFGTFHEIHINVGNSLSPTNINVSASGDIDVDQVDDLIQALKTAKQFATGKLSLG